MKINGNEYRNVPIDFNAVCKLEDMGVDIANIDGKVMTVARAYAALCMRKPIEFAGKEIEKHVQNGGTLNDIYEAFAAEVEKSDFFRALQKQAEAAAMDKDEEDEA
jgi:hypothetical protein